MRRAAGPLLCGAAALCVPFVLSAQKAPPQSEASGALLLRDYTPKTRLEVKQTNIVRAKYPVIDVHLHMDSDANPAAAVEVMDAINLQMVVNMGMKDMWGEKLRQYAGKWVKPRPGRFAVMANINDKQINDPDFAQKAVAQIKEDVKNGAIGLKVYKELGLVWRDSAGKLIRPDDPRFTPVWNACADLKIPVLIHVNDTRPFFDPVDRFNERYLSLTRDNRSSWYGKIDITHEQLMPYFENVIARHPRTTFIAAHVGMHYEHLASGAEWLEKYANLYYDISASCKHLGRQPYTARRFLMKYQDRILFGCDVGRVPTAEVYRYMFRVLETDDEYFEHVEPAAGLPWKIYGLFLPDPVLEKIYRLNAIKVFGSLLPVANR